ncbi:nuclear transport factor 2 family protein, partial [Streptomyces sp. NPDC046316]|uniref:nuclear transport factor 2 family protein n=1 Tax=Streptomyces sp. NPDC046316 TaxID=3154494 RepID=UPI0033C8BC52
MTQRVDLATVMDRMAIDDLVTGYAVAVDDSDWAGYRALFTRDGRADYRGSGGVEGPAAEVADWLAETMRLFPVRQHLIVNRRVRIQDLGGYPGEGGGGGGGAGGGGGGRPRGVVGGPGGGPGPPDNQEG